MRFMQIGQSVFGFGLILILGADLVAQDKLLEPHLRPAHKLTREDLGSVTSVAFSPDGQFLYASAWKAATHVVAKVDKENGKLTHVQTILDEERLDGATGLRLSRDGKLAAAGAFNAESLSLYTRDAKTGKLTYRDHKVSDAGNAQGLDFCIDAKFSTDGRFVYGMGDSGGLTAFRVVGMKDDPKLEFLGVNQDESLEGIRGMAIHPGGRYFFATCQDRNKLVVLKRDPMAGTTKVVQIITNGEDEVRGLEGSFGAAISPDGKFVYTVSGRFGGDDDVCVFEFDQKKDSLQQIQVVDDYTIKDAEEQVEFEGGNEIAVSPDGKNVYTVATESGTLAAFSRDARSGKLTLLQMFGDDEWVGGAAGIHVSPDSRFVAVAAEEVETVSIFHCTGKAVAEK